ncbi:MAG: anaerobic ribonucleoside-triphosphate reductase activating protein [Firmicutes bacterium]|nr:anaerobic ribonucleoside-triphosphate reductase activating protein [Bacillota bacterium]
MKINNYIINSLIDYPGHIACTVFTVGCNLNCWYCHNKKLIDSNSESVDELGLLGKLKERAGFLDGVVICGGEPTLQPDLEEFILKVKALGLKVKLDTNGTNPEVVSRLLSKNLLDYIAMDVKAPISAGEETVIASLSCGAGKRSNPIGRREVARYSQIVGVDCNITDIKSSIEIIKASAIDYEFRTTFLPDLTVRDIENIAKMIAGAKRYYIQKYVTPAHLLNRNITPHTAAELDLALQLASKHIKTALRG